jgi:hypothetical protein
MKWLTAKNFFGKLTYKNMADELSNSHILFKIYIFVFWREIVWYFFL